MSANLLLDALRAPDRLARLDLAGWDLLLRVARRHRLLGRLSVIVQDLGLSQALPPAARDVMVAAARRAQSHQVRLGFEIDRLARALDGLAGPKLLMKGGAYLLARLPPHRGRISSDVDVLVPQASLAEAERRLRAAGWDPVYEDDYTQRYYREWMHELPPLRHRARQAVVDLHHTILPRTHRYQPDAAALVAAARPLDGTPWHLLAPADMVLNVVAHLFADGDFGDALREVVDLHDLLTRFGQAPGFWDELAGRAARHGLARPLGDALWTSRALLGTAVPAQPATWRPVRAMMRAALTPGRLGPPSPALAVVLRLLYIRSHWLRMPPLMLARHLSIKAGQRLAASRDST